MLFAILFFIWLAVALRTESKPLFRFAVVFAALNFVGLMLNVFTGVV